MGQLRGRQEFPARAGRRSGRTRPVLENPSRIRSEPVGVRSHLPERGRCDKVGPAVRRHRDVEYLGEAVHLTAEVSAQIVVVHSYDVQLGATGLRVEQVPQHTRQRVQFVLRGETRPGEGSVLVAAMSSAAQISGARMRSAIDQPTTRRE